MERESIEELVRENHGILLISRRDFIQVIVPLDLPALLLDEGLQCLFLNRSKRMAGLHQVYLPDRCIGCRELGESLRNSTVGRVYADGSNGTYTLRMSAISVPLPGPSSIIRMGEELPFANHRVKNQTPMSYPACQPKWENGTTSGLQTYLSEHLANLRARDEISPGPKNVA